MASSDDRTARVQPPPPAAPPPSSGGNGLDLWTLIITALASAASAFICSKVWAPGTLASAAFTPVVVALFREGLRRPTAVVSQALPAVSQALPVGRRSASTRAAAPDDGTLRPVGPAGTRRGQGPDDPSLPPYDPGVAPYEPELASAASTRPAPMTVYAAKRPLRHRWRLAVVTGLLGFAIAAVVVTVPELIAGGSASGGGNTTFFSSPRDRSSSDDPKTSTTTTTETTTETTPSTSTSTTTETTPSTTTETAPSTTPDPATADPGAVEQQQAPAPTDAPATAAPPDGGGAAP